MHRTVNNALDIDLVVVVCYFCTHFENNPYFIAAVRLFTYCVYDFLQIKSSSFVFFFVFNLINFVSLHNAMFLRH